MHHLYQVTLQGLHTALQMIMKGYAERKMDIKNITFSQNVYLRIVEELDLNLATMKDYNKIFMIPLAINPNLLPFTIVVQIEHPTGAIT